MIEVHSVLSVGVGNTHPMSEQPHKLVQSQPQGLELSVAICVRSGV